MNDSVLIFLAIICMLAATMFGTCAHITAVLPKGNWEMMRRLTPKNTQSVLNEDINNFGTKEALDSVENLYNVEDGLYWLRFVPDPPERESGYVEGWSYWLEPYKADE